MTVIERGKQRIRRAHLTGITSIVFRGAMLLSSFLYTPATIHYLGSERYGLWVALTSVATLLTFADCGLGCSLMNEIAYSIGEGKRDDVRRSVTSTFFVLGGIGLAGCFVFAAAYPFIPWQSAFHTGNGAGAAEAGRTIAVIVCGFLLTLPFSTIQRVQSAHQEGYKTQLWEIGGVALTLAGLFCAIRLRAGLPVLAIVFTSGPLLAMAANWFCYFVIEHRSQLPSIRFFDRGHASRIAREGGYFLVLQMAGVAVFSVDSFLIIHYFGQAEFGRYSLVAKVFQVTPALAGVWFSALWPAYAEAIARRDYPWVRRTLRQSLRVSGLFCLLVSCGVAILARPAIHLWTGTVVNPSAGLLTGWIVYWVLVTGTSAVAAFLNAAKFVKRQVALVTLHGLASILFKVLFCRRGHLAGAVWGTNLSYLLVIVPAYVVIVPRLMRQLSLSHHNSESQLSRFGAFLKYSCPTILVAALVALTRPRLRDKTTPPCPRILVTRLDGIGDFVIFSPFLRELRNHYPKSVVTLLVRRAALPLAETCPYVDQVIAVEPDPRRQDYPSYASYLAAFLIHLRKLVVFTDQKLFNQIDIALHPRWDVDIPWGTLLTFLSSAPRRVAYSRSTSPAKAFRNAGYDLLFTDVLPSGGHVHEVDKNLEMIRYLGGTVRSRRLELWLTEEDHRQADQILFNRKASGSTPLIAFGVGAFERKRRWPFYGELISSLDSHLSFTPLVFLSKEEEDVLEEVRRWFPGVVGLQNLPLRVVAAVLARCDLFVGNDSGPLHMACAVGCPVVEISCHPRDASPSHPNAPERFGPLPEQQAVLRPGVPLDGCTEGCENKTPHCIATITPEEVAAEVVRRMEPAELKIKSAVALPC